MALNRQFNNKRLASTDCIVVEPQARALPICSACRTEGHRMNEKAFPNGKRRLSNLYLNADFLISIYLIYLAFRTR